MCPTMSDDITPIDGGTFSASSTTPCVSESGETSSEAASMAFALTQTAQCVAEVPRIILWC
jgi:hypothetical protein